MLGILLVCILIIFILLLIWHCIPKWFSKTEEPFFFLNIPDTQLYKPNNQILKPSDIQYQIPIAQNQLTDLQLQSIDTDILRNVRVLKNFSLTDELSFSQMYNLLKQMRDKTYQFKYISSKDNSKKFQVMKSERVIEINTNAINKTDLDLFYRLKLELISAFNSLVIRNGYYIPYHKYQFFKIINNNLISNKNGNYVFTMTIAREFKFQQFVLYWDVNILETEKDLYIVKINKIELIGIPIPKTIQFHENKKTEILNKDNIDLYQLLNDNYKEEKDKKDMLDIFKDQVKDSATFDVQPIGDGKMFQSPATKFIDVNETSDMSPNLFDANSLNADIENKIMNLARDKQFQHHRCFGLINGVSKELVEYNDNPIFCKSYHPEISQVGIWDAPCQVNTDCPFYQANKNYPNEFGKCIKETGKCEMPLGIIPIGFTRYGKLEPQCYNCDENSKDNRCCSTQIISSIGNEGGTATSKLKSPDYIFLGDESTRREFATDLEEKGLQVNPSIF